MDKIQSYRDLIVWQKGIDLSVMVYKLADCLPDKEKYGLCSQMCRASTSIPANIAEGYGRNSTKEFIRHLSIARGSLLELETHIILAVKLSFLSKSQVKEFWDQSQEVGKMLVGLIHSLESKLE